MATNATSNEENMRLILHFNSSESAMYGYFRPAMISISLITPPIWWSIGIPGNLASLMIWLQPRMRHNSGFYLATLAIMDIMFLLLNILFEVNFAYDKRILDTPILCELNAVVYLACQYVSPVLMLGFTIERYMSVCHPFKFVARHRNKRCTFVTISSLIASCLALALPQGYFWTITGTGICDLRDATQWDWAVWTWVTEGIIFGLIPLAVLALNVLVVVEMKKISALEKRNMRTKSIDRRSTTFMLLCVSFYQIFTVLPATVAYSLYRKYDSGDESLTIDKAETDPKWQSHFDYMLVKSVIMQVSVSHYAANFFIYLATGKLFRRQLYELLAMYCCKGRQQLFWAARKGSRSRVTTRTSFTSNRDSFKTPRQICVPNNSIRIGDAEVSVVVTKQLTSVRGYQSTANGHADFVDREHVPATYGERENPDSHLLAQCNDIQSNPL